MFQTSDTHASALRVEDLHHSYGARKALAGVTFAVARGSLTVLLGLNGAGKTTLFLALTRLQGGWTGKVRVFGLDPRERPTEVLARIGVVFEEASLDRDLTPRQNLRYHAALHGIPRDRAETRIAAELSRAGLGGRANERLSDLSGGQRRRAELARALLHQPSLLLLDEPTVGLDVPSRRAILKHVRALCAREKVAVLWATHLIEEVRRRDSVVVLHRGRQLAAGSASRVIRAAGRETLSAAFSALTGSGRR